MADDYYIDSNNTLDISKIGLLGLAVIYTADFTKLGTIMDGGTHTVENALITTGWSSGYEQSGTVWKRKSIVFNSLSDKQPYDYILKQFMIRAYMNDAGAAFSPFNENYTRDGIKYNDLVLRDAYCALLKYKDETTFSSYDTTKTHLPFELNTSLKTYIFKILKEARDNIINKKIDTSKIKVTMYVCKDYIASDEEKEKNTNFKNGKCTLHQRFVGIEVPEITDPPVIEKEEPKTYKLKVVYKVNGNKIAEVDKGAYESGTNINFSQKYNDTYTKDLCESVTCSPNPSGGLNTSNGNVNFTMPNQDTTVTINYEYRNINN
jgi:hypothetical protein